MDLASIESKNYFPTIGWSINTSVLTSNLLPLKLWKKICCYKPIDGRIKIRKINTDESYLVEQDTVDVGGIIRDSLGEFIYAFSDATPKFQ